MFSYKAKIRVANICSLVHLCLYSKKMSVVTENAIIQILLHIFKFWPAVDKGELLPLVGKL
jgi:hypothetical protein